MSDKKESFVEEINAKNSFRVCFDIKEKLFSKKYSAILAASKSNL